MKRIFLFLSLVAATNTWAQDHMTPELLWQVKRIAPDGLSANGKTVYYSARQYDWQTEKSKSTAYTIDLATGERTEGVVSEGKTVIRRDKKYWYATDESSLYVSDNIGRSWKKIFSGLEGAENVWVSPDGKYVAFSKDVLVKPTLGSDIYPDLPNTTLKAYTDLNDRHWDTWEDGKFSHIFVAPVKGGKVIDIMVGDPYDCPQKPHGGAEDLVWNPNSGGFAYVCKKKFGKEYAISTNTDVYYYDISSKHTTNYTKGMMGYDTQPAFSPDGKYISWLSMKHDGFEADKNDLYIAPVGNTTSGKVNLTAKWDETVGGYTWNNNSKSIFIVAAWRGTEQVFEVGLTTAKAGKYAVDQITDGKFDVNGIVGQSGEKLIVTRCDMNHASELYTVNVNNGKMKQLSHENDGFYSNLKMSNTELRKVKTTDGKMMGVWVIYPPDFDPAKKYPTLLYCQGGPQSALSQFYSFRWNFQLMAAQGYIVVAPNRRGMPGWGVKWNADISGDWGGQPMRDYLAAIDDVAKESYVDKNRLGCVGASYGGYSVYMLAGMHDGRFKTFIAHDGLFDLKSWYGTTEELWFANWDIKGAYWQKPTPKGFEQFNPSNFVDKWTSPILIIQGGIDYRVPIEQGHEAFQAAQLRGIKSKLLYFPNENHWILHAQNGIAWQREFYKWLNETLK